jgi:hypothetical protein
MYKLGLSFLLGSQIFTLILFLCDVVFGLKLSFPFCASIFLFLLVILLLLIKPKLHFSLPALPRSRPDKLIFIFLFLVLTLNLNLSFWHPVVDWDAVTLYDFRAQIILKTGHISDTLFRSSYLEYPLFTSLNHYCLYLLGLSTPMPFYSLLYIAFILVMHHLLIRSVSPKFVYPALLLISFAPKMFDQSGIAYTNLPYTIYLLTGAGYLFLWSKEHRRSDLILGLALSLMTFWIRTFPFALANILGLFLIHSRTRRITLYLLLVSSVLVYIKYFLNLSQLLGVINFAKTVIFDYYFPYPYIFLLLLIKLLFKPVKNTYFYWLIALYFLLFVGGTVYAARTLGNYYSGIPDAAQRMMMFINPAILWLGFAF